MRNWRPTCRGGEWGLASRGGEAYAVALVVRVEDEAVQLRNLTHEVIHNVGVLEKAVGIVPRLLAKAIAHTIEEAESQLGCLRPLPESEWEQGAKARPIARHEHTQAQRGG